MPSIEDKLPQFSIEYSLVLLFQNSHGGDDVWVDFDDAHRLDLKTKQINECERCYT